MVGKEYVPSYPGYPGYQGTSVALLQSKVGPYNWLLVHITIQDDKDTRIEIFWKITKYCCRIPSARNLLVPITNVIKQRWSINKSWSGSCTNGGLHQCSITSSYRTRTGAAFAFFHQFQNIIFLIISDTFWQMLVYNYSFGFFDNCRKKSKKFHTVNWKIAGSSYNI